MLVKSYEQNTFALDNFEGPLAFLLHLVQKSELHISDISLRELIQQYIVRLEESISLDINAGAEFVHATASLLWLKSKMLLPARDSDEEIDLFEADSPFAILPKLVEYCRFKEIAKDLETREQNQQGYYFRGSDPHYVPSKKMQGIEKISLGKLAELFQEVLRKKASKKGLINEEVWRVKDKMVFIRQIIKSESKIPFEQLFSEQHCRAELIVTFLAILEMMKLEELCVIGDGENHYAIRPDHE